MPCVVAGRLRERGLYYGFAGFSRGRRDIDLDMQSEVAEMVDG